MRLAVLADIHGNLPALEAVLADLPARQVDGVVNLGDCVSGPLWPADTLARLRALRWPTVRGNHDRRVGLDAASALGRTDADAAAAIDPEGRRWLAALPPTLAPRPGILALHARSDDDEAYLMETVQDGRLGVETPAVVAERLGDTTATLILAAHSHLAGVMRLPDGRWILNPGSVGCPAYADPDPPAHVAEAGSPAARYAVVTPGSGGAAPMVELIVLPYDHATAARRAAALGRPVWAHALMHGTMPPGALDQEALS